MICPRCRKIQRGNPLFCRSCGQKLFLNENPRISASKKGFRITKGALLGFIIPILFFFGVGATFYYTTLTQGAELLPVASDSSLQGMGELHGVIVGVSDYRYINDLNNSDDSAKQINEQLGVLWGEQAHLTLLVDEDATRTNIESAMTELARDEDADDIVLFFFIGHGSEEGTICPHDTLTDSWANDITASLFDRWLDALDSKQVIVVLDSCFAGNFAEGISQDGRVVLTSCDDTPSWEGYELSNYIVEGFSNPQTIDTNLDSQISVEELYTYISSQNIPVQHPQLFDGDSSELILVSIIEE